MGNCQWTDLIVNRIELKFKLKSEKSQKSSWRNLRNPVQAQRRRGGSPVASGRFSCSRRNQLTTSDHTLATTAAAAAVRPVLCPMSDVRMSDVWFVRLLDLSEGSEVTNQPVYFCSRHFCHCTRDVKFMKTDERDANIRNTSSHGNHWNLGLGI